MNDLPENSAASARLVQQWQLRFMRSQEYLLDKRAEWARCRKRYHLLKDAAYDPDEPNIALGYVYGLVEQIFSKVTEPILKMRPPCPVQPNRLGDLRAAKNFEAVARAWYSKPGMQDPFTRSKKRMVIEGPRVEIDEWVCIQRDGKIWGKAPKTIEVQQKHPQTGAPMFNDKGQPIMLTETVLVDAEVPRKITVHEGFHTRYPKNENCYPEPYRTTIGTGLPTDCSWFMEDMEELALEEMAREKTWDPETGMDVPKYDFTALLKDAGLRAQERYAKILAGETITDNYGPLVRPNYAWDSSDDGTGQSRRRDDTLKTLEDRDMIWVVRCYEAGEILTIANGKYIIHRKKNPWHVPILPIRVESLTMDPDHLFGTGVIKPIEDELDIRNDIVNMSLSQLIRTINKMQFIVEGRIISMADFKPRAGGKIRLNGDMPARDAVFESPVSSATSEMLALDSFVKGNIEYTSANLDGSQGVRGTKQEHKTARGMEMIVASLGGRFITIQRQAVANEAARMTSMERFFSQHQWDKIDVAVFNDDGSTSYAQFNKDDVATDGRGFRYSVDIDPTWGDTRAQREDSLDNLHEAIEYLKVAKEFGDETWRLPDVPFLFENLLRKSGYVDVSGIFTMKGKIVSPEDELQRLMEGGTIECQGDLLHHIETHILQAQSPALKSAMESGKANPETLNKLGLAIQQASAKVRTFMADPAGAAGQKRDQALRTMPK